MADDIICLPSSEYRLQPVAIAPQYWHEQNKLKLDRIDTIISYIVTYITSCGLHGACWDQILSAICMVAHYYCKIDYNGDNVYESISHTVCGFNHCKFYNLNQNINQYFYQKFFKNQLFFYYLKQFISFLKTKYKSNNLPFKFFNVSPNFKRIPNQFDPQSTIDGVLYPCMKNRCEITFDTFIQCFENFVIACQNQCENYKHTEKEEQSKINIDAKNFAFVCHLYMVSNKELRGVYVGHSTLDARESGALGIDNNTNNSNGRLAPRETNLEKLRFCILEKLGRVGISGLIQTDLKNQLCVESKDLHTALKKLENCDLIVREEHLKYTNSNHVWLAMFKFRNNIQSFITHVTSKSPKPPNSPQMQAAQAAQPKSSSSLPSKQPQQKRDFGKKHRKAKRKSELMQLFQYNDYYWKQQKHSKEKNRKDAKEKLISSHRLQVDGSNDNNDNNKSNNNNNSNNESLIKYEANTISLQNLHDCYQRSLIPNSHAMSKYFQSIQIKDNTKHDFINKHILSDLVRIIIENSLVDEIESRATTSQELKSVLQNMCWNDGRLYEIYRSLTWHDIKTKLLNIPHMTLESVYFTNKSLQGFKLSPKDDENISNQEMISQVLKYVEIQKKASDPTKSINKKRNKRMIDRGLNSQLFEIVCDSGTQGVQSKQLYQDLGLKTKEGHKRLMASGKSYQLVKISDNFSGSHVDRIFYKKFYNVELTRQNMLTQTNLMHENDNNDNDNEIENDYHSQNNKNRKLKRRTKDKEKEKKKETIKRKLKGKRQRDIESQAGLSLDMIELTPPPEIEKMIPFPSDLNSINGISGINGINSINDALMENPNKKRKLSNGTWLSLRKETSKNMVPIPRIATPVGSRRRRITGNNQTHSQTPKRNIRNDSSNTTNKPSISLKAAHRKELILQYLAQPNVDGIALAMDIRKYLKEQDLNNNNGGSGSGGSSGGSGIGSGSSKNSDRKHRGAVSIGGSTLLDGKTFNRLTKSMIDSNLIQCVEFGISDKFQPKLQPKLYAFVLLSNIDCESYETRKRAVKIVNKLSKLRKQRCTLMTRATRKKIEQARKKKCLKMKGLHATNLNSSMLPSAIPMTSQSSVASVASQMSQLSQMSQMSHMDRKNANINANGHYPQPNNANIINTLDYINQSNNNSNENMAIGNLNNVKNHNSNNGELPPLQLASMPYGRQTVFKSTIIPRDGIGSGSGNGGSGVVSSVGSVGVGVGGMDNRGNTAHRRVGTSKIIMCGFYGYIRPFMARVWLLHEYLFDLKMANVEPLSQPSPVTLQQQHQYHQQQELQNLLQYDDIYHNNGQRMNHNMNKNSNNSVGGLIQIGNTSPFHSANDLERQHSYTQNGLPDPLVDYQNRDRRLNNVNQGTSEMYSNYNFTYQFRSQKKRSKHHKRTFEEIKYCPLLKLFTLKLFFLTLGADENFPHIRDKQYIKSLLHVKIENLPSNMKYYILNINDSRVNRLIALMAMLRKLDLVKWDNGSGHMGYYEEEMSKKKKRQEKQKNKKNKNNKKKGTNKNTKNTKNTNNTKATKNTKKTTRGNKKEEISKKTSSTKKSNKKSSSKRHKVVTTMNKKNNRLIDSNSKSKTLVVNLNDDDDDDDDDGNGASNESNNRMSDSDCDGIEKQSPSSGNGKQEIHLSDIVLSQEFIVEGQPTDISSKENLFRFWFDLRDKVFTIVEKYPEICARAREGTNKQKKKRNNRRNKIDNNDNNNNNKKSTKSGRKSNSNANSNSRNSQSESSEDSETDDSSSSSSTDSGTDSSGIMGDRSEDEFADDNIFSRKNAICSLHGDWLRTPPLFVLERDPKVFPKLYSKVEWTMKKISSEKQGKIVKGCLDLINYDCINCVSANSGDNDKTKDKNSTNNKNNNDNKDNDNSDKDNGNGNDNDNSNDNERKQVGFAEHPLPFAAYYRNIRQISKNSGVSVDGTVTLLGYLRHEFMRQTFERLGFEFIFELPNELVHLQANRQEKKQEKQRNKMAQLPQLSQHHQHHHQHQRHHHHHHHQQQHRQQESHQHETHARMNLNIRHGKNKSLKDGLLATPAMIAAISGGIKLPSTMPPLSPAISAKLSGSGKKNSISFATAAAVHANAIAIENAMRLSLSNSHSNSNSNSKINSNTNSRSIATMQELDERAASPSSERKQPNRLNRYNGANAFSFTSPHVPTTTAWDNGLASGNENGNGSDGNGNSNTDNNKGVNISNVSLSNVIGVGNYLNLNNGSRQYGGWNLNYDQKLIDCWEEWTKEKLGKNEVPNHTKFLNYCMHRIGHQLKRPRNEIQKNWNRIRQSHKYAQRLALYKWQNKSNDRLNINRTNGNINNNNNNGNNIDGDIIGEMESGREIIDLCAKRQQNAFELMSEYCVNRMDKVETLCGKSLILTKLLNILRMNFLTNEREYRSIYFRSLIENFEEEQVRVLKYALAHEKYFVRNGNNYRSHRTYTIPNDFENWLNDPLIDKTILKQQRTSPQKNNNNDNTTIKTINKMTNSAIDVCNLISNVVNDVVHIESSLITTKSTFIDEITAAGRGGDNDNSDVHSGYSTPHTGRLSLDGIEVRSGKLLPFTQIEIVDKDKLFWDSFNDGYSKVIGSSSSKTKYTDYSDCEAIPFDDINDINSDDGINDEFCQLLLTVIKSKPVNVCGISMNILYNKDLISDYLCNVKISHDINPYLAKNFFIRHVRYLLNCEYIEKIDGFGSNPNDMTYLRLSPNVEISSPNSKESTSESTSENRSESVELSQQERDSFDFAPWIRMGKYRFDVKWLETVYDSMYSIIFYNPGIDWLQLYKKYKIALTPKQVLIICQNLQRQGRIVIKYCIFNHDLNNMARKIRDKPNNNVNTKGGFTLGVAVHDNIVHQCIFFVKC